MCFCLPLPGVMASFLSGFPKFRARKQAVITRKNAVTPPKSLGRPSRGLPAEERGEEAANAQLPAPTHRDPGNRGHLRNNSRLVPLLEQLHTMHSNLLLDLQQRLGQQRAEALYRNHICRSQYLLVHGNEVKDAALAQELARILEEDGQTVEGPWSIRAGDIFIEAWQRLASRAKTVVVLLSPALFQDTVLCRSLAEMQYTHPDTIVPLFLEPSSPRDLPLYLTFLSHAGGRTVPEGHWDPHPFIEWLVGSCQRLKHFCREIQALNFLLDSLDTLENCADYVCACGRC